MKNLITTVLIFLSLQIQAQDKAFANGLIKKLCSEEIAGRGYVNNGVNQAAYFISQTFDSLGLKPIGSTFYQHFSFPINTFPAEITCILDGKTLRAGEHFLMQPNSGRCTGRYILSHYDLADSIQQQKLEIKNEVGFKKQDGIVLKNIPKNFEAPSAGLIVRSTDKKMMHSLSQQASEQCQLLFPDSIIKGANEIFLDAQNVFVDSFECANMIGHIPSKRKKKKEYIVFTAHYDHLGKMGQATFPGASDNASGTAMVLDLARHFAKLKNKYNIAFILFAGEEVGLLGSEYFTENPLMDLSKIKMLINLDIMGSAENGIVVVNATEFPKQFAALQKINTQKGYLPEVRSRGPTKNSDHYHFYKKGVPSYFIYSNGGPGFYHDIYDTPDSLPMNNYENVFKLLVNFIIKL